jgi:hypothetical protein
VSKYLLSTYSVADESGDAAEEHNAASADAPAMMAAMLDLEAEMDASGTFVFGGALHGPDAATVVAAGAGGVVMTDGPFVESKEHIAGFYIIEAADLDEALTWARRVSECVSRPIEVSPFAATGRLADHMGESSDS